MSDGSFTVYWLCKVATSVVLSKTVAAVTGHFESHGCHYYIMYCVIYPVPVTRSGTVPTAVFSMDMASTRHRTGLVQGL